MIGSLASGATVDLDSVLKLVSLVSDPEGAKERLAAIEKAKDEANICIHQSVEQGARAAKLVADAEARAEALLAEAMTAVNAATELTTASRTRAAQAHEFHSHTLAERVRQAAEGQALAEAKEQAAAQAASLGAELARREEVLVERERAASLNLSEAAAMKADYTARLQRITEAMSR